MTRKAVDAVVLGAGAAGLAAAGELAGAGLRVAVLEARDRIGGRIWTVHDPDLVLPIELGAEFIHGAARATLGRLEAHGLVAVELEDRHWLRQGTRFTDADFSQRIEAVQKRIPRRGDRSVAEFLRGRRLSADVARLLKGYVEGYHAAHLDRISARWFARTDAEVDDPDAHRQFRIPSGYGTLLHALRSRLPPSVAFHLATIATRVQWERGRVVVHARSADGRELEPFRAPRAIVSLPLGVLKAPPEARGAVRFVPALGRKQRALDRLEVGQVVKVVLFFRTRFWEALELPSSGKRKLRGKHMHFLHAFGARVPTWWTALPFLAPVLTAWAGGPVAEALLAEPEAARIDTVLATLAETLGVRRRLLDELLTGWKFHDWQADPFSRGAYSHAGVGGSNASRELARPLADTLFFAGEATDSEQTATVAGAFASGERAGRALLARVRAR